MTDAEIVALVARAIGETDSGRWADHNTPWQYMDEDDQHWYGVLSAAVVAALTEAGRMVSDGCVSIDRERWKRVRAYAEASSLVGMKTPDGSILWYSSKPAELRAQLQPGDLDAEPTP